MDADRAIAIINTVLAPKSLNSVQIQIIGGAIAGDSYQKIAATRVNSSSARILQSSANSSISSRSGKTDRLQARGYQTAYIKETAARLWQSLSQRLGRKVTKKSLAAVLIWYVKQPKLMLTEDSRSNSSDLQRWTNGSDVNRRMEPVAIDAGFYGRTEELATLTDWCLCQRCRLILLVGMGGMGKTTLAWKIAHQLVGFDRTIWRSLLNLPPICELCADLIQSLMPLPLLDLPDSMEGHIELLIVCLKRDRCLLILDNVESILAGQVPSGQYLVGYEGYDRLFRAISELPHQSCAILTSREQPQTIARSQLVNPQLVRSMTIDGITSAAGHQLIQSYGCPQLPPQMWQEVHEHYGGNPLALKIAAITAVEITGGGEKVLELYPMMKRGQLQFRNIDDVLCRQFERLSNIEQQLVYWLAIERKPVTGVQLRSNLVLDSASGEIINALRSLSRRCIIVNRDRTWSMLAVMITYVIGRSIDRFVTELVTCALANAPTTNLQQHFWHLNTYAIIQEKAQDYLRQIQIKSILRPILARLLKIWERVDLRQHLRQILSQWQTLEPIPCGYLVGNILNLLMELEPNRL